MQKNEVWQGIKFDWSKRSDLKITPDTWSATYSALKGEQVQTCDSKLFEHMQSALGAAWEAWQPFVPSTDHWMIGSVKPGVILRVEKRSPLFRIERDASLCKDLEVGDSALLAKALDEAALLPDTRQKFLLK